MAISSSLKRAIALRFTGGTVGRVEEMRPAGVFQGAAGTMLPFLDSQLDFEEEKFLYFSRALQEAPCEKRPFRCCSKLPTPSGIPWQAGESWRRQTSFIYSRVSTYCTCTREKGSMRLLDFRRCGPELVHYHTNLIRRFTSCWKIGYQRKCWIWRNESTFGAGVSLEEFEIALDRVLRRSGRRRSRECWWS